MKWIKNTKNSSQVTLFAVVALAASQKAAERYPAGVDPSKCPNFPICDNAALHAPANHWAPAPQAYHAPAPQQWNQWQQPAPQQWQQPAPQWQAAPAPQWQPAPAAYQQKDASGGDKYPAGVDPSKCPNYPYCDTNALHAGAHHQARANPLPGFTERLYPAGVSAHSCPNYPEC